MTFPIAADVNETALAIFAIVVGITLFVTYLASKRMTGASRFTPRPRDHGPQDGFAIAGDYMSAASFLGIAGRIFLFASMGSCTPWVSCRLPAVLFLLSERMRNSGKFHDADVSRPDESAARPGRGRLGTLSVGAAST